MEEETTGATEEERVGVVEEEEGKERSRFALACRHTSRESMYWRYLVSGCEPEMLTASVPIGRSFLRNFQLHSTQRETRAIHSKLHRPSLNTLNSSSSPTEIYPRLLCRLPHPSWW